MSSYLVVKNTNSDSCSYLCKDTHTSVPYLKVDTGYLDLTTETTTGTYLVVKNSDSTYRPKKVTTRTTYSAYIGDVYAFSLESHETQSGYSTISGINLSTAYTTNATRQIAATDWNSLFNGIVTHTITQTITSISNITYGIGINASTSGYYDILTRDFSFVANESGWAFEEYGIPRVNTGRTTPFLPLATFSSHQWITNTESLTNNISSLIPSISSYNFVAVMGHQGNHYSFDTNTLQIWGGYSYFATGSIVFPVQVSNYLSGSMRGLTLSHALLSKKGAITGVIINNNSNCTFFNNLSSSLNMLRCWYFNWNNNTNSYLCYNSVSYFDNRSYDYISFTSTSMLTESNLTMYKSSTSSYIYYQTTMEL